MIEASAKDQELARRLWQVSCELTGVDALNPVVA